MEYFDNPQVLETTANADDYKKAQNMPNLMGRSYLSPNSLRGRVFQAPVNYCGQEPFSHGNPDTYLRKIGAGKLWPMPKVVDEKEAKAMSDFWRRVALDAYKEFTPVALNFADLFNQRFRWMFQAETTLGLVDDDGDDEENKLPWKLSGLIRDAWEAVMSRNEFKDLFGADTKLPEHAGSGFDAWTQAFQGVKSHQSVAIVGTRRLATEVPVAVYDFTPSNSDANGETNTEPDFTDYEEHCKNNKLAYLIPWLNLEDLASPEGVTNMILSRAMHAPLTFARSDWNAMQVGRSGRLLREPYCDSCFMDFHRPPMILENSPSSDYFTGAKSYGILITRPSSSDILGKYKKSHDLGQIFGWGDGLLILQAQATILRFCAEITKLMVRCHVTDKSGQARPDLDVLAGKPKFLSLHHSFPIKFYIPGVPWNVASFQETCNVFFNRNEQRSSPRSDSPSSKARERSSTVATQLFFKENAKSFLNWFAFQEKQMNEAFPTGPIRSGMVEINSLRFQHISPKLNSEKLEEPAWSAVPLAVAGAMQTSAHAFARMVEFFLVNHWGRVPSANDKQQLAHLTSTDIAAKRLLANDVIRRLLRHCMFGSLIRSEWTKTVTQFTNEPRDPGHFATMSKRLLLLRKFAEVAWTMLRGQGLLHGTRTNAELCERDVTEEDSEDSKKTPDGLMRNRVPGLARFVGSSIEPGNSPSTEQEGDNFKDFFKLFELGPPETAYGFPSMDLLAQKLVHSFMACHEPDEGLEGVYDSFIKSELHNLRLMTNQISLLERKLNAEGQRGKIHVRPKDVETEVQRNLVWKFIDKFDNFDFEKYVKKKTLAAIHSRVLGIRDTNEAEIETTQGQASQLVLKFLVELDERMFQHDADVINRYRNMINLYRNLIDEKQHKPGEEYAVCQALVFADGGSLSIDEPWRPNLSWGEIRIPDLQDGEPMDIDHPDEDDGDDGTPERMDIDESEDATSKKSDTENTKPAKTVDPRVKMPKKDLSPNKNHKPPPPKKRDKRKPGNKSKPKTGDSDNSDDDDQGGPRRLRRRHIETAEKIFEQNGQKAGSISANSLASLLKRMGFHLTNENGSIFAIRWTSEVRLPNLNNQTTYALHRPHGGDGEYWHGTEVGRLARNLATFDITWNVIEQTYFGPGCPNARMVRSLGWTSSEGDDWSVDGVMSEVEDMDSPATEMLEPVNINGVGKRRREDDDEDEGEDEEEGEFRGFKKIRSG